jgi:hypothetical protein
LTRETMAGSRIAALVAILACSIVFCANYGLAARISNGPCY